VHGQHPVPKVLVVQHLALAIEWAVTAAEFTEKLRQNGYLAPR
jgi:hypothetical protein